ncbi:unnamed protein product [Ixodes persulcatus]
MEEDTKPLFSNLLEGVREGDKGGFLLCIVLCLCKHFWAAGAKGISPGGTLTLLTTWLPRAEEGRRGCQVVRPVGAPFRCRHCGKGRGGLLAVPAGEPGTSLGQAPDLGGGPQSCGVSSTGKQPLRGQKYPFQHS